MNAQNQAWLIRRVIYAVGFIAGIVVVLMGKADIGTVDGWSKYLDQLAGLVTVVASGLAVVKTGPASDDSPVVVEARDVIGRVIPIQDAVDYLENRARSAIDMAETTTGTPLDAALRDVSE